MAAAILAVTMAALPALAMVFHQPMSLGYAVYTGQCRSVAWQRLATSAIFRDGRSSGPFCCEAPSPTPLSTPTTPQPTPPPSDTIALPAPTSVAPKSFSPVTASAPKTQVTSNTDKAISRLLDVLVPLDRGFAATPEQRKLVDRLLCELIALSPFSSKTAPPNLGLGGDWELAYTNAPDILGIRGGPIASLQRVGQQISEDMDVQNRRPRTPTRRVRTFAASSVSHLHRLTDPQTKIDVSKGTIANVLEYAPSAWLRSPFEGIAAADRLQQRVLLSYTAIGSRVELQLLGTEFRAGKVLGVDLSAAPPLTLQRDLSLPFGSFEILYNDGSLRVVKTAQGYWGVNKRLPPGEGW